MEFSSPAQCRAVKEHVVSRKQESRNTEAKKAIFASFGLKSNGGKSTAIRLTADYLTEMGRAWSGISVDRSERLPDRYPQKFTSVKFPTDTEGRLDPYGRTRSFSALDEEIERLASDGGTLLLDIGSGEYPGAFLDHASRTKLGGLFKRSGIAFSAFVVTTNDAIMMADVPRVAAAILNVLPDARIIIALNQKTGSFSFSEGSAAYKVWVRDIQPLLAKCPALVIPGMPPGTWDPFEDQGLRFSQVALLDPENKIVDEKQLMAWTHDRRGLAIARQGDVAEWLHGAWRSLSAVLAGEVSDGGNNAE
jgi:hypothetical protein